MTTSEQVAKTFSRLLVRDLGPHLVIAIQRNRDEESSSVCHTHDFCDANMVMMEAMIEHGLMKDEDSPLLDENVSVWNKAWDIAKRAEFDFS